MNRNQLCNCNSGKKYKKCCGNNNSLNKTQNKYLILLLSIILICGFGYGFKIIMDKNRVNANLNSTLILFATDRQPLDWQG